MKHKTKPSAQKQREKPETPRANTPASDTPPALWLLLGILLFATLIAYLPTTLLNGFTNWDDLEYVVENPLLSLSWENLPQILTRPVACNIHPVTMFSLGIDDAFGGNKNAFPYHATSLFLHCLNTVLVFFFARRVTRGSWLAGFVAALFFGIHPMHVESVAWVAARKDVLYTAFFFLGLLAYFRFLDTRRWGWYALAFGLAVLSCFSKPAAVVFPLVMLLIDFVERRSLWNWMVWLEKLPFLVLSLWVGKFTLDAQAQAMHAYQYSSFENLVIGMYGFMQYFIKAFWWGDMSAFYPYPKNRADLPQSFYAYVPMFLVLVSATIWSLRRTRMVAFGIGFYAVTVALVLKVVAVGGAILAERYTYVPYVGLFLVVGWLISRLPAGDWRRRTAMVVVGVFALLCIWKTRQQTALWKDTVTLFTETIKHYPSANIVYVNRAIEYQNRKQYEIALRDLDMADSIEPNHEGTIKARGFLLFEMKKYARALEDFKWLQRIYPDEPKRLLMEGGSLVHLQRHEEAIAVYDRLLKKDSLNAQGLNDRASAHFFIKKYPEAIADYTKALQYEKQKRGDCFKNRAASYLMTAQYSKAITDVDSALIYLPKEGTLFYYRSAAENKLGQKEAARSDALQAQGMGYALPPGYLEGIK
ncbi:MAG: tetratricopeptide repeat protein [Phycisphaerae bacterium]|nr:tetratricopeptide repeat protein [Saprospiraceae bacterium]